MRCRQKRLVGSNRAVKFAGVIYHADSSLCVKLFPAGLHNQIDWNTAVLSENNLCFYDFASAKAKEEASKIYIEFSKSDEYAIEPLRIKETIRYKCSVFYEKTDGKKSADDFIRFNPRLKNESNKLLKIERDDSTSLTFQFINYLGKSELVFDGRDGNHRLPFEVVPDKIRYEEDYVKLTEAIADECSALLLDYTSPTSLRFLQDSQQKSHILEQFIFLRTFCFSDNLERLFASIKRNPDRMLIKEEEIKPFGQGIPSQKFFSNPFSHSRGWTKTLDGFYVPGEVSAVHKYDSYDTPANRFVKFALITFSEVCNAVLNKVSAGKDGKEYSSEAEKIISQIDAILNDSFFDDISELEIMPVNNQILEKREGYSQIFNAFSMLDLALQLDWKGKDDVYTGEAKNAALLYEYWLFFELRNIMHELSSKDKNTAGIEPYTPFIDDADGLTVSLQQENPSMQSFSFEKEKCTVNLYYNRTFSPAQFKSSIYWGSYSRPFRPDYTLAVFSSDYRGEIEAIKAGDVSYIHFDAKYRIQDLTQFIHADKKTLSESSLEKPEELVSEKEAEEIVQEKSDEIVNTYRRGDLLKMHTYNDAIRRTVGSYVLYPGTETDSEQDEQASVYDEILPGVGAFAVRPGDGNAGHKAVKEFIRTVIEFKGRTSSRQYRKEYFENSIIRNAGEKTKSVPEAKSPALTMIGFVREKYYKYLQDCTILPRNCDDTECLGKEFYFYFHAIKDGQVYTLHKETCFAKYLRLTLTDAKQAEIICGKPFEHLEPWRAEVLSTELVSKQKLQDVLKEYPYKTEFQADYYYLVKAKIDSLYSGGIVALSTEENSTISPYSPKIVMLEG